MEPRNVFIGGVCQRVAAYEGGKGMMGLTAEGGADALRNAKRSFRNSGRMPVCTRRRPEIMQTAANSIEVHRK